jgi:hypothetical protein
MCVRRIYVEFDTILNSICKLMYKVGTCSSDANMLVRKMLPRVRAIRLAYNREGRRGSGPSMG